MLSKKVYDLLAEPTLILGVFFFIVIVMEWRRTVLSSPTFKVVHGHAMPHLQDMVDKAIDRRKEVLLDFVL